MREKVEKMRKQCALSEHPLAQQIIVDKFGADSFASIAPSCILKGWLFYPLSPDDRLEHRPSSVKEKESSKDVVLEQLHPGGKIFAGSPEHLYVHGVKTSEKINADSTLQGLRLNPHHWHGWWSRSPELIVSRFSFRKGHRWLLAPKLLWGSPVRVSASVGGLPGHLLRMRTQQQQRFLFTDGGIEEMPESAHIPPFHFKNMSRSALKLLDDKDFVEAIHKQREEALALEKHRMLRVLVVELTWDVYVKSWVEVSRGFCVEENW